MARMGNNAATTSLPPLSLEDCEHVLKYSASAWEEHGRNARLFITGGTGFFGRWLLETFAHINSALRLDARLVVLTRDPDGFRQRLPHLAANPAIALVRGDVRTFDARGVWSEHSTAGRPWTADHGFDGIIHAATAAGDTFSGGDALGLIESELDGTRQTLKFARETRARRFLFVSSGAVYGAQPDGLNHLSEDYAGGPDPTAANAAYGEGKRASETLCACVARQYGMSVTIARAFAFVGPHLPLDRHYAIGNFLRDRLAGSPVRVTGTGLAVRSYLYAADLAVWLWTILFRGKSGRAYNVGSEDALSIMETAAIVARTAPDLIPAVATEGGQSAGGIDPATLSSHGRYVPSTLRAREELGLSQAIELHEAVRRTLAWLRSA